jgi:hypothetical protein
LQKDCPRRDHPNFNKLKSAWSDSKFGKVFKEYGYPTLPADKSVTVQALQSGKAPRNQGEHNLAASIALSAAAVAGVENSSAFSFLIPGFLLFHRG